MSNAIVPDELLARFADRAVNLHPALLPNCRGRAPRQSMLVDGVEQRDGGVSAHVITSRLDRGPIVGRRKVPCTSQDDWWSWDRKLALAAAELFAVDIPSYLWHRASEPQGDGYYRKVRPDEFAITAGKSVEQVRALLACLRRYPVRVLDGSGAGRFVATVERFTKLLGPKTGQPARRRHGGVDIDLLDARVRLDGPGLLLELYRKWLDRRALHRARAIGRTHWRQERYNANAY